MAMTRESLSTIRALILVVCTGAAFYLAQESMARVMVGGDLISVPVILTPLLAIVSWWMHRTAIVLWIALTLYFALGLLGNRHNIRSFHLVTFVFLVVTTFLLSWSLKFDPRFIKQSR